MKKDNLIMSLWMLLVLLMMLSTCCKELKEDYKPKQIVNYNTVKEIDTKEPELRCPEGIPPEKKDVSSLLFPFSLSLLYKWQKMP